VALEKAERLNPKFWMIAGISACDAMLVVGRTVVVVIAAVVVVDSVVDCPPVEPLDGGRTDDPDEIQNVPRDVFVHTKVDFFATRFCPTFGHLVPSISTNIADAAPGTTSAIATTARTDIRRIRGICRMYQSRRLASAMCASRRKVGRKS